MRRGVSLIGILVVLGIIVVLYSISFESLKGIRTGVAEDGSAVPASQGRITDMFQLQQLMQSLNMSSMGDGEFPRPSAESGDEADDTTASMYSLLVARRLVSPEALISPMDQALVEPASYDWSAAHDRDRPWDPRFSADLSDLSNVSYAHLALWGDRDENWASRLNSSMPIFSSRGPQDGQPDPASYTCDPDTGRWTGHVVFGDGRVVLLQSLSEAQRNGRGGADHFFRIDDDERHADAILGFTSKVTSRGPILQWD